MSVHDYRFLTPDEAANVCASTGPVPAGMSWSQHLANAFIAASLAKRPPPEALPPDTKESS